MEPPHLPRHPPGLRLLGLRKVADHRSPGRQDRLQLLFDAIPILVDQGVGHGQDLRRGAVVLHHQDGLGAGEFLVKVQQVLHVGAPPGVDGLVRVPHDEEILVVSAQHFHQLILQLVDVLKLVDHDVFQPLLPLDPDVGPLPEDVQGEFDQVVVVQAEALLFLVEIAVEDDVRGRVRPVVLLFQGVQGHGDHVLIVVGALEQLLDLDHVPGGGKGHVPQGQPPLLVDDPKHGVDVRIVQHQKASGVLDGMAVLPQHGVAEAVERVDVPGVVVSGQLVDALAHLICRLVGEGDAENVPRQDAQLVHQVSKAAGQGPGLAGACPGDDPDISLCGSNGPALSIVEAG